MNYLSHPNKLLSSHIENIAAFDPNDRLFALAAKFHDIGKTTDSFQRYIRGDAKSSEPHAFVSGALFLIQFSKELDAKSLFFVLNAIISHHGALKSAKNIFDDILPGEKLDLAKKQSNEISKKAAIVQYFGLSSFDFGVLDNFEFDCNDPSNPLSFTICDYIRQKELFSKLIFADKYEAIFSATPQKKSTTYPLKNLHNFKAALTKNDKRDKARESVFKAFESDPDENIYLLTAPTGIGKTLLSLELALKIKEQRGLERIIYTIPFTSIIDQTVEIFETIYRGSITKHHHKVEYNINDSERNNIDIYQRLQFITESWNEPFIVSTFYQLFFALFSNDNADNIKFQSLRNSVVVMDEVQAIPHQLWSIMKKMFDALSKKLNTVFVLMSATMPIITKGGRELADKEAFFGAQNRYKLRFSELHSEDEEGKITELANLIKQQYKSGKSTLCVVNTIKNSKKLFKALKDELGENVFCLNSYMLGIDREKVIKELKEPNSNLVKNKILISTQVIEAGVDLDFDVGFRELSPLSSIIQTAGRINREGAKEQADVYVFDTLGFEIYDRSLMNETKKHLTDTLRSSSLEEKNILSYIESYFRAVGNCLGDSKEIGDAIKKFDFDEINKAINDIFKTENDMTSSVAIGIDLKEYEKRYFEAAKTLGKWELKTYKEQIFKEIGAQIVNIKKKDLKNCGVEVEKSEIFGVYYFVETGGIYSKESGFLIKEERDIESCFD
jgi:CRISPR-associated endonuclease/helicase Cas3